MHYHRDWTTKVDTLQLRTSDVNQCWWFIPRPVITYWRFNRFIIKMSHVFSYCHFLSLSELIINGKHSQEVPTCSYRLSLIHMSKLKMYLSCMTTVIKTFNSTHQSSNMSNQLTTTTSRTANNAYMVVLVCNINAMMEHWKKTNVSLHSMCILRFLLALI